MEENTKKQLSFEEELMLRDLVSTMVKQRNDLGVSQRELAEWCGMPQSSIARFETMKTVPNLRTVLRMMYYLGMIIKVDSKKSNELAAEIELLRKIEIGEKSGEEEGWIPFEEVKARFDKKTNGI